MYSVANEVQEARNIYILRQASHQRPHRIFSAGFRFITNLRKLSEIAAVSFRAISPGCHFFHVGMFQKNHTLGLPSVA